VKSHQSIDAEERIVVNDKYPDQTVVVVRQLPTNFKKKLQDLLRSNANIFAWTYTDMTRILRTIMVGGKSFNTEHKLNEYKHIKPIKQKKRGLGPYRSKATCKEVDELTKARILQKFKDQTWVANPVMVKKSDGGYHQIQMAKEGEDKTTFFTGKGVFCYRKMPFGLKNVGATYQRLVDKVFSDQIGRNLEAYVDDMVIKRTSKEDMLKDIQETFDRFRSINMKLNPKKCSFSVDEGPSQAESIIEEIHEGSCGFNAKLHSMVVKFTKQGYYWPSMYRDAIKTPQEWTRYQAYSTMEKAPNNGAITVSSTWPFNLWGITILEPLLTGLGSLKFLAIAVEHSTKWVEEKPLTTANG
nr:reverse transcriptase domain-containing protein [Tanacetum cinerariifolium]